MLSHCLEPSVTSHFSCYSDPYRYKLAFSRPMFSVKHRNPKRSSRYRVKTFTLSFCLVRTFFSSSIFAVVVVGCSFQQFLGASYLATRQLSLDRLLAGGYRILLRFSGDDGDCKEACGREQQCLKV